jgi:6-phospho-3-hexuloisomerase
MQAIAAQARRQGAIILLFTTDVTSPLAELADWRVVIPAPAFKTTEQGRGIISIQPLGTLFEQSLFILCDCLILGLMQRTGVSAAQMAERHANLE